jgi:SAM-dependent methyltransferase
MTPDQYDGWYHTDRGRWIGEIEFRLILRLLAPEPGARILDVGCGTGYFTRRFAAEAGLRPTGLDPDLTWLRFARGASADAADYCAGRAERLPFGDRSFDLTVSVAALCFVRDEQRAVREIVRVTRKRFAIGLLNRNSLLYLQKGRRGGVGAYRGAHWHTPREVRRLFDGLAVRDLQLETAILLPSASALAQRVEGLWHRHGFGAFLLVSGAPA